MWDSGRVAPQVTEISVSKPSTWRSHLYPTESRSAEHIAEIYTSPISATGKMAAAGVTWIAVSRASEAVALVGFSGFHLFWV